MFPFPKMPSTPSELFTAYASLTGTIMLFRSVINELIPDQLRSYIYSTFKYFLTPLSSSYLTLVIDENCGYTRNQVYDAAETYLRTKISPTTERLKVSKTPRQKHFTVAIEKGEEIVDRYDGVELKWKLVHQESQDKYNSGDKWYLELVFEKKYKDMVFDSYLPHVLARSKQIKEEEKVVKLYTRDCGSFDDDGGGVGAWGSINLEHPATFDKIAMDPELKKTIIDDLERFVERKDYYKKVGKAWKRGYLLYGPPGTGKSSLIAAMANYLKFDIYDLELSSLYGNSDLRRVLLSTTNRSILVIEDIDCSAEVRDRENAPEFDTSNTKLTLSGLLNFIDGLWSSCGDERIIIFTTNHKDRLDPALLRPGRMDVHIHMSYCTPSGFRLLAANYLNVHDNHSLFGEIEGLIENTKVTPAQVAEELMKTDNVDLALNGLVNFLRRKSIECEEIKEVANEETKEEANEETKEETDDAHDADDIEPKQAKKRRSNSNAKVVARNVRRRAFKVKVGRL